MITPWQVQFLGGLRISRDGQPPLCRLRTAKTTALLAFLCIHIGRDQGRDELVDRFWPDMPLESGRNSLRIALSALRKILRPADATLSADAILLATRSHVRLCAGTVECDVNLLERALRRGDRMLAGEIAAKGPFLPGVSDEWVYVERERVEALRFQALEKIDGASPAAAPTTQAGTPKLPLSRSVPGNVSAPLGRFFGRDAETMRLLSLFADPTVRLITIAGPGGTGKTRLAVETARALREGKAILPAGSLGGGVWFVPLVSVTQGSHIVPEICRAVGAPISGSVDSLEILAAHLATNGSGRTVLLLDNLEQIETEGCAEVLITLLERIPEVAVLTTSRRRIGLPGERVLPLSPFPLPEADNSLGSLAIHPAVALFVDRARDADIDFALTARHAPDVVDLCIRLNGVPLALEMAASWAGVYSPGEMAARVADGSAEPLPGRHAGRQSRHRSLRAVAEWSIRLLPAEARDLLGALSVFHGRWTRKAAVGVLGETFTPESLALLCDHSLVAAETVDGVDESSAQRYFRILPSLRPFAQELLDADSAALLAIRRDHARYFTQGAVDKQTNLDTIGDTLAALSFWEAEAKDSDQVLRLVGALWAFWWIYGQWTEAKRITERVLSPYLESTEAPEVTPEALRGALRCAAKLAFYRNDFDTARAYMTRRLALEEECGNALEVIHLKANFATLDIKAGKFEEAGAAFEAILPLLPTMGPNWAKDCGYIVNNYADALVALGQNEAARVATEGHLRDLEDRGDVGTGIDGLCWERLATIHRATGALDEARACAEKALDIFRRCSEIFRVADMLLLSAAIARESGDPARALTTLREAFALRRRVPSDDGFRRSVEEGLLLLADYPGEAPSSAEWVRSMRKLPASEAFAHIFRRLEELADLLK